MCNGLQLVIIENLPHERCEDTTRVSKTVNRTIVWPKEKGKKKRMRD